MAEKEVGLSLELEVEVQEVEFYPVPNAIEQQQIFSLLDVSEKGEQESLVQANRCFVEAQKSDPPKWFLVQFIERVARTTDLAEVILLERLLEDYPTMPIEVSEEFLFDKNGRVIVDDDEEVDEDCRLVSQALPINRIIENFVRSLGESGGSLSSDGVEAKVDSFKELMDFPTDRLELMKYWASINIYDPPLTKADYERVAGDIRELKERIDLPKTVIEFIDYWDVLITEAEDELVGIGETALRIVLSNILLGMILRDVRIARLKGDLGRAVPIVSFDETDDMRWGTRISRELEFYRDGDEKTMKVIKKTLM